MLSRWLKRIWKGIWRQVLFTSPRWNERRSREVPAWQRYCFHLSTVAVVVSAFSTGHTVWCRNLKFGMNILCVIAQGRFSRIFYMPPSLRACALQSARACPLCASDFGLKYSSMKTIWPICTGFPLFDRGMIVLSSDIPLVTMNSVLPENETRKFRFHGKKFQTLNFWRLLIFEISAAGESFCATHYLCVWPVTMTRDWSASSIVATITKKIIFVNIKKFRFSSLATLFLVPYREDQNILYFNKRDFRWTFENKLLVGVGP